MTFSSLLTVSLQSYGRSIWFVGLYNMQKTRLSDGETMHTCSSSNKILTWGVVELQLVVIFIVFSIKTPEINEKYPSQFKVTYLNVFIMSDSQSKSQIYSIYKDIKQRKTANSYIGETWKHFFLSQNHKSIFKIVAA